MTLRNMTSFTALDRERPIGQATVLNQEIRVVLNADAGTPAEFRLVPVESDEVDLTAESLTCGECGEDGPDTLAEAVINGWQRLIHDPEGASWNFLGVCPECLSPDD